MTYGDELPICPYGSSDIGFASFFLAFGALMIYLVGIRINPQPKRLDRMF